MARGSRPAAPAAGGGSALRKRVLGERASSSSSSFTAAAAPADEGPSTVLGSAEANAYFNAKRLKQGGTGAGRKRRASAADPAGDHEDAAPPTRDATAFRFTVRPVGETAEILRRVDAREDAWRRASPRHAWPSHEHSFRRWGTQLRAGFSVLLHGVGSKLALLQAFADSLPDSAYVVHVHGELPSVALREVLTLLQHEVLEMAATDAAHLASLSFVHQCRALVDFAFAHRDQGAPDVYLLVHSLDGPALRDPELQAGLARLARAPPVHLLATVESVNAPALWAEDDVQRFRWVHHRVDTLRAYTREIDLRVSAGASKAAEQSISGVRYILQSLTPTDVGTLRLIAQQQLASDSDNNAATRSSEPSTAVSATAGAKTTAKAKPMARRVEKHADYHAVYAASRKLLLHATMQSFKNSVKCLQDNGLVRLLRVKNTEKLLIPLADELIQSDIIATAACTTSTSKK